MVKKIMSILLIFSLLWSVSYADKYIERKPSDDQINLEKAIDLSTKYIEDLTGISASDLAPYISEYNFGPGYQWMDSTVEDDCWILVFATTPLGISRVYVLVHGTTGDILSWNFMDTITGITFSNAIIDDAEIPVEQANKIALEYLANVVDITIEELENNIVIQLPTLLLSEENQTLWDFFICYTIDNSEQYSTIDIDASTGEIISCEVN